MQNRVRFHTDGIGVENLLNGSQSLIFMENLRRRRKGRLQGKVQRLAGKALQFLAKDNGVGATRLDELNFLGRE